jgi:hypothetical protein
MPTGFGGNFQRPPINPVSTLNLLSHDVVALLVFEKLVHLHDVGVILSYNEG